MLICGIVFVLISEKCIRINFRVYFFKVGNGVFSIKYKGSSNNTNSSIVFYKRQYIAHLDLTKIKPSNFDLCPVHLPVQNIFCPGQNQICPRQINFVQDKIFFVQDKNFVQGLN